MTLLDRRQINEALERIRKEHPKFDGTGCKNHVVCSEYEDARWLRLLGAARIIPIAKGSKGEDLFFIQDDQFRRTLIRNKK